MKPYAQILDRRSGWKGKKLSTKDDVYHPLRRGHMMASKIADSTAHGHSRPSAKRTVRNAARAQRKSARQRLKRLDQAEQLS